MIQKADIHGHSVAHEENSIEGVHYLRDGLDGEEARVFFDQARSRGSAEFEDHADRQFTLIYQNSAYTLVRR